MSSDTDHPRQRTVAELLAAHGDSGATGRRRRRRAADDVPGEDDAPPPGHVTGTFGPQWQPTAEPDRSMLRERVPPAQPPSRRQPEREPQPWESDQEPRERRARETPPWESSSHDAPSWDQQPREQQPREPLPREPWESRTREAQPREPQQREPQQPRMREAPPWESIQREAPPWEQSRPREPQPWEAQPREPQARVREPQPRDPSALDPLPREPRQQDPGPWQPGSREFPPREPPLPEPRPRESQRDGRPREAVSWESRPRDPLAPPRVDREPEARQAPPVIHDRPAPVAGPVRERPTEQMAPVREARPGVMEPPGRGASRRPGAPFDPAPGARPEYGSEGGAGEDGPSTEVGMAPVGAEAWHRQRTLQRAADDGGPPTEASAALDYDRPAGLGGTDLDDFDGDQDYPGDLEDDLDHGDLDGADERAGRRQRGRLPKLADSAGQVWAAVVAQWIIGAIGGAALWVGFRFLWRGLPVVALAAAVLVTAGLVVVVRALLRNNDMRTTVFAVLVGLLLTASPAILVLVGR
jgi:hypothetical protein